MKEVTLSIAVLVILIGLIALGMWGCPTYNVWEQNMKGKAALAKAEQTRQILITQAKAEKDAASQRADAIKIVGQAAKDFPEYSSTMASCTMVSSRCVSRLSTGMREVSAIVTMKKAIPAKMAEILKLPVLPIHSANTAIKAAGSAKLEINISRDDPMPPNALPASSPPSARKNRPRASRKRIMRKSPIRHSP